MIDKKTIIHVGLHKTGSTFLQKQVFPKLDQSKICYNPEKIFQFISENRRVKYDEGLVKKLEEIIFSEYSHIEQDTVLFSFEAFYGHPYNGYFNFDILNSFLKKNFSNIEIIIVFRNQPDWLISNYKQVIHRGETISLDEFLNFRNGKFQPKKEDDFRTINALNFDYSKICQDLIEKFGVEKTWILFYEDLVSEPFLFVRNISNIIGSKVGKIKFKKENKSYSSLSIKLSIIKGRIFNQNKNENLSFRKEGLKKKRRNNLTKKITWRFFIQNIFDRIIYIDWDILGKHKRKLLLEYYLDSNSKLDPFFPNSRIKSQYC